MKIRDNVFLVKLSESFFGIGADKLFVALLPFVAVKIYGATIYGEYTYYFSIATMLSILSKVGLDTGLLYFIPRNGNRYVSGTFVIVGTLSIAVGAVYLFIERSFLIYIPLFILLSLHALFMVIHRATAKIKEYYIVSAFVRQGLTLILLFILYRLGANDGILIAFTAGYLVADIALLAYNRRHFRKIEISKELVLYSLPLLITSAMAVIMDQIDVIMLRQYFDEETVGIYNIAAKLATLPAYLLTIFNTVFAPKISELYHEGKEEELKKIYTVSARLLMGSSLIIVLVVILLNQWILGLFGKEFLAASNVVLYRGIGQVINCSVGSVWYMLSMTGRSKLNMIGTSSAAIINIILNFMFIPRMGMDGAAIASMIAISFISILGYILVKKYFNLKVYKFF